MLKRMGIISFLMVLILGLSILGGCSNNKDVINDNTSDKNEINNEITVITTDELKERLNEEKLVVVDTRSTYEYNGWKLNGELRGGHIKNAISFPLYWTTDDKGNMIEDKELKALIESKDITLENEIVVYGSTVEDSKKMIDILKSFGYKNLKIYEAGLVEWAKNSELPMDKLVRYDKLVYPAWINDLIENKNPETYNGNGFKIFEVSWGEPKEYDQGHIPGAIHLDTNEIEEEPLWNRKSDDDLEKMLLKFGVTNDTTVILYGSDTTAAARAASIMMYAGVEDVRLLDGGYNAWVSEGFEIETTTNEATSVESFGVKVPVHPEYIIDTNEVKEMLANENEEIVSIRSWEEYIGETSGYSYIKPMGRISGALWGHAGSDPYHMEDYRNIDNTMLNYNEIDNNWKEWGITSDKKISFHCGTGWRASEAFFDAYLMGWENISVYDGGWFEWSMDESNPVEFGDPTK